MSSPLDWLAKIPGLTLDGWANTTTGVNDPTRDKRTADVPNLVNLSYGDALTLYRASDIVKTVVNLPVDIAFKAGFDVRIPGKEDLSERLGALLDDLQAPYMLKTAVKKRRLFGGAIVAVGASDGANLDQPLGKARSIDWLQVFDPFEARAERFEGDPTRKNYGQPAVFQINPLYMTPLATGVFSRIHASRCLYFTEPRMSRLTLGENSGFGDSFFDAIWTEIRDFESTHQSSSRLIDDFAQGVLRIPGIARALAADQPGLVKKRIALLDLSRSVLRALVLDKDEEFSRTSTPVSGLAELLDRHANRVSAATRIPVTILMGQAPAGLNATGSSDLEAFRESVATLQTEITPQVEQLVRVLLESIGENPPNWSVVWRPISQPTEAELAETRQKVANTDQVYFNLGVLSADEIRKSRFEGDAFSIDTQVEETNETEEPGENENDPTEGPSDPASVRGATDPGTAKAADTALNGAQVTAAVDIVTKMHAGALSRESAIAMLSEFFNLSTEQAERIAGPKAFKAEPVQPIAQPQQNQPQTQPTPAK